MSAGEEISGVVEGGRGIEMLTGKWLELLGQHKAWAVEPAGMRSSFGVPPLFAHKKHAMGTPLIVKHNFTIFITLPDGTYYSLEEHPLIGLCAAKDIISGLDGGCGESGVQGLAKALAAA